MHHHAWLIFVFLVETGFHHVDQDSLELLTSGDLPASASQGAGIIGVSHDAWPTLFSFYSLNFNMFELVCSFISFFLHKKILPNPSLKKNLPVTSESILVLSFVFEYIIR